MRQIAIFLYKVQKMYHCCFKRKHTFHFIPSAAYVSYFRFINLFKLIPVTHFFILSSGHLRLPESFDRFRNISVLLVKNRRLRTHGKKEERFSSENLVRYKCNNAFRIAIVSIVYYEALTLLL
jgi:hypothetical protein